MCTNLEVESRLSDRLFMHLWQVAHVCELTVSIVAANCTFFAIFGHKLETAL